MKDGSTPNLQVMQICSEYTAMALGRLGCEHFSGDNRVVVNEDILACSHSLALMHAFNPDCSAHLMVQRSKICVSIPQE